MTTNSTKGIFLAAGKGSRMQPLTDTLPKPLAKVNGQTLLEINMQKAEPLVDEFVLVVSWLKEQIMEAVGDTFMGKPVKYVVQENPKGGTLDAFRAGVESFESLENINFFVANTDNINGDQYYQSLKQKIELNPHTCYALAKRITDREALKSFGIFKVTEENEFIEIVEKPQYFVSELANLGLYYFPSKAAKMINLVSKVEGQEEEYIIDLLNLFSQENKVEVVGVDDEFVPISTVADLERANKN